MLSPKNKEENGLEDGSVGKHEDLGSSSQHSCKTTRCGHAHRWPQLWETETGKSQQLATKALLA